MLWAVVAEFQKNCDQSFFDRISRDENLENYEHSQIFRKRCRKGKWQILALFLRKNPENRCDKSMFTVNINPGCSSLYKSTSFIGV